MNRQTMEALNRINLAFYDKHGEEFSSSRLQPWPGWARIVAQLASRLRLSGRRSASILDLASGNGRFAAFVAERITQSVAYCGLDSSLSLLAAAHERQPRRRGWKTLYLRADIVRHDLAAIAPDPPFDLIAIFGLLHHVPGFERRRELLLQAAGLLGPGGLLAVTFWQFGASQRFLQRVIAWPDHNREAREPIDVAQLEPGDLLLAWGGTGAERAMTRRRYCHFADLPEAERLVGSLGLSVLETFTSDGETGSLNLYYLMEAAG